MPLSLTPSDEIAVPILVKFAGLLYVTKIDHNCFRSILDDHGKVLKLREVQRGEEIQKCWSAQVTIKSQTKNRIFGIYFCAVSMLFTC